MNDLKLWQFTLRIGVLEPYCDLRCELRGATAGEDFTPLQDEILEAVEAVIARRAGQMKGLAQVAVVDVETRNVEGLVPE